MSERVCTWCQRTVTGGCEACLTEWKARPAASTMTAEQRADELVEIATKRMTLEINFSDLHERIEALAGRGVWTHELVNVVGIADEVRREVAVTFDDVLAKIPSGKRIVVALDLQDDEAADVTAPKDRHDDAQAHRAR